MFPNKNLHIGITAKRLRTGNDEDATLINCLEHRSDSTTNPCLIAMLELIHGKQSDHDLLDLLQTLRKLLSATPLPSSDPFVESNFIPFLVDNFYSEKFLNSGKPMIETLLFESCWILTNLASDESDVTSIVANSGCVPFTIKLLRNAHYIAGVDDLSEQCLWLLANIVGDGPDLRDICLAAGLPEVMQIILKKYGGLFSMPLKIRECFSLLFSNILRHNTKPVNLNDPQLENLLARLLNEDLPPLEQVPTDFIWALSYLTNIYEDLGAKLFMESKYWRPLLEQTATAKKEKVAPILRCLGPVIAGSGLYINQAIDSLLAADLLAILVTLTKRVDLGNLSQEIFWILSNIAVGDPWHAKLLLTDEMLALACQGVLYSNSIVAVEAAWVLSNLCACGNTFTKAVIHHPDFVHIHPAANYPKAPSIFHSMVGAMDRLRKDEPGMAPLVQATLQAWSATIVLSIEDANILSEELY